jgi:hypothetical protein
VSEHPRVFFSYSWSSEDFARRVVELATQLQADGVEVVLDRWDLKEGQDKHAYMERAVNDRTISRVLVLCDPTYVSKANDRQGGVGTETLIISPEVYKQAAQQKFLPVIMDRDDTGQIVVPTYLEGRIYVDLSDPRTYPAEYQRLVRNIYNKPDLERPPLGKRPAYLDQTPIVSRTGLSLKSYQDAVLRDQRHQDGLLSDYLDKLGEAYEAELLPDVESFEQLDDAAGSSIEGFQPYRDEFVSMLQFAVRYAPKEHVADAIHAFFERGTSFRLGLRGRKWDHALETENLAFISWELFLYAVAVFVRGGQFGLANRLLRPFYMRSHYDAGALRDFAVLDPGFRLLDEYRNHRLGLRKYSLAATLLHERRHPDIPFASLAEADLILWFRACTADSSFESWYPRTLVYGESIGYLPSFARAQSRAYFESFRLVLGVASAEELRQVLDALPDERYYQIGQLWGRRRSYEHLIQSAQIATRP